MIALGIKHATRIEDAVRLALIGAEGIADFFDLEGAERFFVKNLERVQGDERDAIILSIGYGKTPHGRMLHRFGPLNLAGGERRLNVAITRARRRMTVVSSFTAADLEPTRLKARGAVMLRDFLLYAADGGSQPARQTPAIPSPPPDPLVEELASRLRAEGLVVHPGYGTSGQRLDLAVEDPHRPGRVLVAVETDGLSYAAMLSTRDRDRLRIEQLRRLGWRHVRVWSTDLFRDPVRDLARVSAAVRAASAAHPAVAAPAGAAPAVPAPAAATPAAYVQAVAAQAVADQALVKPGVATPRAKPEQTRDDTDAGWGEPPDSDSQDQWLREQRPPHWG